MRYLNQLDYRHIHYEHNVEDGGVPQERRNIATSGCGICCCCMLIEQLTHYELSLHECIRLIYRAGANKRKGLQMTVFGQPLADEFGLGYKASSSMDELLACLQKGGRAVINVGGDHDDYVGLYSNGGHCILAISYDGNELCILDPGYKPGKYESAPRAGKVRVDDPFTYCKPQFIAEDTQNRELPFHLFWRK